MAHFSAREQSGVSDFTITIYWIFVELLSRSLCYFCQSVSQYSVVMFRFQWRGQCPQQPVTRPVKRPVTSANRTLQHFIQFDSCLGVVKAEW